MAILYSVNMSLPVPGVGTEIGPDYAIDVNSCLSILDTHDHSAGKGVQVTPSGLNINANLAFQNNMATGLSGMSFTQLASPSATLTSLYVAPGTETVPLGDLWYTDSAGNQIQITQNGNVNATIASIPGESYAAGTFFWKQGTGSTTPANFDIGSIVIRPNIAATTFGVTLSPPALISSAWTLTLPPDPSSNGGDNFLIISTTGVVTSGALVDNSSIEFVAHQLRVKAGGITAAMLASGIYTRVSIVDVSSSGTTIAPTGTVGALIQAIGGGGGGGGGGRNSVGGDGGNGSTPVEIFTSSITSGTSVVVTIGAGGSGGAGQAVSGAGTGGSNGNPTTIVVGSTTLLTANGGNGGGVTSTGGTSAWGPIGNQIAGGRGANGSSNTATNGANSSFGTGGTANPTPAVNAGGGGGGAGGLSTGINGATGSASGLGSGASTGGRGYGGGGGGGQGGSATSGNFGGNGGAGAQGLVRIVYFISP